MSKVITRLPDLLSALDIPTDSFDPLPILQERFPIKVPASFTQMIKKGDIHDPLLRQVLPLPDELEQRDDYSTDPVGDTASSLLPGLLQKYHGRALLYVTDECAIHCRFCFRKHFKRTNSSIDKKNIEEALNTLSKDTTLSEVILSGGDPLMLPDAMLAWILEEVDAIPHIKRIRIHTRIPVINVKRVTKTLLKHFATLRSTIVMALHVNHPNEIVDSFPETVHTIKSHNIHLLSQSVLLKGVNDSLEVLTELFEKLVHLSIQPYYLHQLDKVVGSAHFWVPETKGMLLMHELRKKLPGYAVPAFVKEVQGFPYKVPLLNSGNNTSLPSSTEHL